MLERDMNILKKLGDDLLSNFEDLALRSTPFLAFFFLLSDNSRSSFACVHNSICHLYTQPVLCLVRSADSSNKKNGMIFD